MNGLIDYNKLSNQVRVDNELHQGRIAKANLSSIFRLNNFLSDFTYFSTELQIIRTHFPNQRVNPKKINYSVIYYLNNLNN